VAGEKRQCKALKAGGGRCSNRAQEGQDYCWSHSRETAEERRENARAGGLARSRRPPNELEVLKEQIRTVSAAVLQGGIDKQTGSIDRATAAVAFQGFNTLLRAVEVQRKLDHQAELEERLAELEAEVERRQGVVGRWGTSRFG
jgi:hypothetical protein